MSENLPATQQVLPVRVDSAPSIALLPVEQMRAITAEYQSRRANFREWLLSQMVEGVHYGVVPGCEGRRGNDRQWKARPSLYKAGADFLCDLLKMRPVWHVDHETWAMLGSKPGTVCFRCELINDGSPFFDAAPGAILGEGRGAGAVGEKSANANKATKDAQKRAKVDAVITALGLSDLFTQDIEDYAAAASPRPDADTAQPRVAPRGKRGTDAAPAAVTVADLKALYAEWQKHTDNKQTREQFMAWAAQINGKPADADMSQTAAWTREGFDKCREVIL